ncbi:MAG: hypothetical protein ABSG42_04275, partial [Nitrospirota bacterium]
SNHRISLELALIKAASRPIHSVEEVLSGIKGLKDAPVPERREVPGTAPLVRESKKTAPAPKNQASGDSGYYENPAPPAEKIPATAGIVELWEAAAKEIRKSVGEHDPVNTKVRHAAPVEIRGSVFYVSFKNDFLSFQDDEVTRIEEALTTLRGEKTQLSVASPEKGKGKKSLADVKKEKEKGRKDKIKEDALADPFIKSALDLFGGEIEDLDEGRGGL